MQQSIVDQRFLDRPQRRFAERGNLFAQLDNAVFPVALGVEPRKRGGKCRVVPAARQPRGVVNKPQRTQCLDQIEFAGIEFAEVFVAGQQIAQRAALLGALTRQQHP